MHALIYKSLTLNGEWPSREELMEILAYLRAFASHGVARPQGGSLFQVLPEMHSLGIQLAFDASHEEFREYNHQDVKATVDKCGRLTLQMWDILDRVELREEAQAMVKKGFTACVERFPHSKVCRPSKGSEFRRNGVWQNWP